MKNINEERPSMMAWLVDSWPGLVMIIAGMVMVLQAIDKA